MSDIVERLMICASFDPDQKEAAEEIIRLRAECDALRAELAAEREAHRETLRLHYCDEDAAILKAEREFRDFGYTPGGRKLNIGERIKHAESRARAVYDKTKKGTNEG